MIAFNFNRSEQTLDKTGGKIKSRYRNRLVQPVQFSQVVHDWIQEIYSVCRPFVTTLDHLSSQLLKKILVLSYHKLTLNLFTSIIIIWIIQNILTYMYNSCSSVNLWPLALSPRKLKKLIVRIKWKFASNSTQFSRHARGAGEINFVCFFLYLLRADLNVLLAKAEATSPHYSPSSRDVTATRERVAFRSLRPVTLVHACSLSFFFLLFPRDFRSLSLSLSPFFLCPSGLSSLRFTGGFRTTPAGHNTRYPWRRVLPPFTRASSLFLLIYFRRRSTKPFPVSLINSFASADGGYNRSSRS